MNKALFLSLLLLWSCQTHSQWQAQRIKAQEELCSSLTYNSQDPTAGINVELLQHGSDLVAYLQVNGELTPNKKGKVLVTLISESSQTTFKLPYRQGQQRVKLSRDAMQALMSELEKHPSLTLELAGYREILQKEQFDKALKKLRKGPSFLKINVL